MTDDDNATADLIADMTEALAGCSSLEAFTTIMSAAHATIDACNPGEASIVSVLITDDGRPETRCVGTLGGEFVHITHAMAALQIICAAALRIIDVHRAQADATPAHHDMLARMAAFTQSIHDSLGGSPERPN